MSGVSEIRRFDNDYNNTTALPRQLSKKHDAIKILARGMDEMRIDTDSWIGNSNELKRLEKQIEKFACVDFPVMIYGEKGTGKKLAAKSLHLRSNRHSCNFVQSCCMQWDEDRAECIAEKLYKEAQGGTLYLRNINALPDKTICKLQHYWEREYIAQQIPVRLVCSISEKYDDTSIHNSTAPWLTIQLPNLTERASDIRPLISMLLDKYSVINRIDLDQDTLQMIENHRWKDNVKGLEKVIALLSVITEDNRITTKALEKVLSMESNTNSNSGPDKCHNSLLGAEQKDETLPEKTDINQLICDLSENKTPVLTCQHPALIKSLNYISRNYGHRLSLEEVAEASYVSPSHLSYLYRKHLDISFKQLLLNLRIQISKDFLKNSCSRTVTWISNEVGFHDLSHFEKTFKRIVGVSPLYYRNH
jgi:transcriptional regulator with AAA-type ATPase domain